MIVFPRIAKSIKSNLQIILILLVIAVTEAAGRKSNDGERVLYCASCLNILAGQYWEYLRHFYQSPQLFTDDCDNLENLTDNAVEPIPKIACRQSVCLTLRFKTRILGVESSGMVARGCAASMFASPLQLRPSLLKLLAHTPEKTHKRRFPDLFRRPPPTSTGYQKYTAALRARLTPVEISSCFDDLCNGSRNCTFWIQGILSLLCLWLILFVQLDWL